MQDFVNGLSMGLSFKYISWVFRGKWTNIVLKNYFHCKILLQIWVFLGEAVKYEKKRNINYDNKHKLQTTVWFFFFIILYQFSHYIFNLPTFWKYWDIISKLMLINNTAICHNFFIFSNYHQYLQFTGLLKLKRWIMIHTIGFIEDQHGIIEYQDLSSYVRKPPLSQNPPLRILQGNRSELRPKLRIPPLNAPNDLMACQTVFLSIYVAKNTLQLKGSRPLLLSYLCPRQAPQGSLYQPRTADN